MGLCTPTHIHTYTDGTEPSMGSTHSDLMKLMESLSWSGMSWEEGYGLLSLRTFQMLVDVGSGLIREGLETASWDATPERNPRAQPSPRENQMPL